jgi:hypothetical protein
MPLAIERHGQSRDVIVIIAVGELEAQESVPQKQMVALRDCGFFPFVEDDLDAAGAADPTSAIRTDNQQFSHRRKS